ncbi:riboflavin kinase [Amycolatopsis saalfeldensis]|uniref:Bifunctional riboflavin kinase/FMN adenylyltransferase n=1 Tax=Amycolatopsis saalfeldensis TaxID=394193 RepID=A0A1H8U4A7_9PSEU|nr:riboflavin kinase [Amycolatopsis saalfeldensis]SEO97896.1 Riboflavin kinase [Amycolatopsis saalfeldensis]
MSAENESGWVVEGRVVRGRQRGRLLGYPTVNVGRRLGASLPEDGVYAGLVELEGGVTRAAAISVGTNPTFEAEHRTLEAHLLDFDDDVYGMRVRVTAVRRLRGMTKFGSVAELTEAIADDVARTRGCVGHLVTEVLTGRLGERHG